MSDAERTTRAPKRATAPVDEVRETIDLGPLSDSKKAGVLFEDLTLDDVFNQTCPDWCSTIGKHYRDSRSALIHKSGSVYTPMMGMRGYWTKAGKECEAHFALNLARSNVRPEPVIVVSKRYGGDDGERVDEVAGRFSIDGARQLIECLEVLINAAEAES